MSTTLQVEGDNAEEGQTEPPTAALTEKLVRKLWAVGSATLVADVGAGLHRPGSESVFGGHKVAYYGILAGVLPAVAVEMATAFWLRRSDTPRLLAFAKGPLPCAVVVLMVLLAVGGFALTVKQA
ncbi:hypothetical protein ACQ4PT_003020 [Festuca glaucescens]